MTGISRMKGVVIVHINISTPKMSKTKILLYYAFGKNKFSNIICTLKISIYSGVLILNGCPPTSPKKGVAQITTFGICHRASKEIYANLARQAINNNVCNHKTH